MTKDGFVVASRKGLPSFVVRPSSFVLCLSPLTFHLSSFILHPSSFPFPSFLPIPILPDFGYNGTQSVFWDGRDERRFVTRPDSGLPKPSFVVRLSSLFQ
jgi:hypothetical protein